MTVLVADCLIAMAMLAAESVDAIVTDPPYHLTQASRGGSARTDGTGPFGRHRVGAKGFMGKTWDGGGVAFRVELWSAALLLLKPGCRLVAFGGTRTYHRMACAIEDAGFEIEDSLCWLYGSGFPKHDSKLKPAFEPIVMARRPAKRATALNIDACRVEGVKGVPASLSESGPLGWRTGGDMARKAEQNGRWPANVVCDAIAAGMIDDQSGVLTSGFMAAGTEREGIGYHGALGDRVRHDTIGDSGGASRFYYCAKASRAEREEGLEAAARRSGGSNAKGFTVDIARGLDRNRPVANHHPTVKPVALMRWLVRLIAPPNGHVLDPFCGSGTTGIAAFLEDRRFTGIECSPEYAEIARARIAHASQQPSLFTDVA